MLMLAKKLCLLFFCKTLLVFMRLIWKGKENTIFQTQYFLLPFHALPQDCPHSLPHHFPLQEFSGGQLGEGSTVNPTKTQWE